MSIILYIKIIKIKRQWFGFCIVLVLVVQSLLHAQEYNIYLKTFKLEHLLDILSTADCISTSNIVNCMSNHRY